MTDAREPIRIERRVLDFRGALNPPQLVGTGYESCRVLTHEDTGEFMAVCARTADDQRILRRAVGSDTFDAATAFLDNLDPAVLPVFRVDGMEDIRMPPNVLNQMYAGSAGELKCVLHRDVDAYACSNLKHVSSVNKQAHRQEMKTVSNNANLAHTKISVGHALARSD